MHFKKSKKQEKIKNTKAFNLSKSPIANMLTSFHMEMKSNREIIVEGCKSIDEYDENMIKIKAVKMSVIFFGRNLEIKCMSFDSLIIEGFVTSIEFNT